MRKIGIIVAGKGVANKPQEMIDAGFDAYELSIKFFDKTTIKDILSLPPDINVVSFHTPKLVDIDGELYEFNLVDLGLVGEECVKKLGEMNQLAKRI